MDHNSLLCAIEIIGTILIAIAALVIRKWGTIRQSFETARETTRANRPQWTSILAGILGANLGYILLVGVYSIATWSKDPATSETFWIPAALSVYLLCAFPIYLPVGAICGLLINRRVQRGTIPSRTGTTIILAVSTFLGAIIAIPIYLVGIMAAAV